MAGGIATKGTLLIVTSSAGSGDKCQVVPPAGECDGTCSAEATRDKTTTIAAIRVLGQIGSRKATKPLIAWLNQQSDCDIMEEAVRALGLARDPEAVSFLLELLSSGVSIQDENYRLKVFAIIALGEIADKRATDGSSSTTPWLPI